MARYLLNLVKGMGTVLEIAPDSHRVVTLPLYDPPASPEEAIYEYWATVGDYLIAASEMIASEQAYQEEKSP